MMKLRKRWTIPLAVIGLGAVWSNQPWFGYNLCLTKGIMHETDFVEEMRPIIMARLEHRFLVERQTLPATERVDPEKIRPAIEKLIDAFRDCVDQNGLEFCRYVGSGESPQVYNDVRGDEIAGDNPDLFRHINKSLPGYFRTFPRSANRPIHELSVVASVDGAPFRVGWYYFSGFNCWTDVEHEARKRR